MALELRTATEHDTAYLTRCMRELILHVRDHCGDPYFDQLRNNLDGAFEHMIADWQRSGDAITYIAEADGMPAGCLVGTVRPPFVRISAIERIGHIEMCWVEPEHRRAGIARRLCEAAETWFTRRGIIYVDLHYMVRNTSARCTWDELGYEPYQVAARKKIG